ncbi:MAG: isoprenylcysteine carboxylmethyltransferase family protein [Rhizobiaceae bacterium]|jgi:protein-S-isoprenylcysteine O-methyltransferase Ste14|nr:isoprenylcysteine carboxylmethyltransferase family protein [Rhizobiaceae bacterium]
MSGTTLNGQADLTAFQRLRIKLLWAGGAVIALLVIFTQSVWEHRFVGVLDLHGLVEIAGIAMIILAVLGRAWATLYIGGRKSNEVVTTGPYSITRNPLYLFSIIGAFGVGAQTGGVVVASVCAILTWAVFRATIGQEERFLSDSFGKTYDTYRAAVPRLWPDFSKYDRGGDLVIKPDRLFRTLRDSSLMLLAFPIIEVIEILQEAGKIPVLFYLW